MKEKAKATKEYLKRQIEWAKADLEEDRARVIRSAEKSDADSIISWANNMKRTELKINELYAQLRTVEHLLSE